MGIHNNLDDNEHLDKKNIEGTLKCQQENINQGH